MGIVLDIDIGGTCTDCVIIRDKEIIREKTLTTRHDLSVGFRKAIEGAARKIGMSLEALMAQTDAISYSTTLAMNSLIERTGPKIGLITTAGHEHMLMIGRSRQWADGKHIQDRRRMSRIQKPVPLIPYEMTVGLRERIDYAGNVLVALTKDEIRVKLQQLVDKGAQGFVVSLLWSFMNPAHERMVREVIEEEYPDHYLGNMPAILSSDVQPKWHEYPRTNMAVINAYLQGDMSEQLSGLGNELRQQGFDKPLMIINNMGGMARVARTRAVDTYGAGPVAGMFGAGYISSKYYGFDKVIVSDMGGTSFDFGLVIGGEPVYFQEWPVIDQWATESSMVQVNTIGAGGGSIAWINDAMGGRLEVGPRSAGSNPGPACYDLGGVEATVTDADVILGYVNPSNFLGGRIPLNAEKAHVAMEKIAGSMGVSVVEAAAAVKKVVDANMGNVIAKEVLLRGHDPKQFVLFAYGGAGPVHCAGYGAYLGAGKIVTFSYSSVFCALGGATMDLKHIYESSRHILVYRHKASVPYLTDLAEFNTAVDGLKAQAVRDMRSEGFRPEHVQFSLDLDMRYGGQFYMTRVPITRVRLESIQDVREIVDLFSAHYKRRYGEISASPESGVSVENFYLTARVELSKPELPSFDLTGPDPREALQGERSVYWDAYGDFRTTSIYHADRLRPGNTVEGPAIIEAADTCFVIPPGMKYSLDRYLTGIMENV